MKKSLIQRDAAVIAGIQKLRFFHHTIVAGEGCCLIDENKRRLLDLSASWGAASLGYAHPALQQAVNQAMRCQAGASVLSAIVGPAVALAEKLLAIVPGGGERRVWLGHSGSDANEAALRAILKATGRSRIISFVGAYHGGTSGSMGISGHSSQVDAARHPGVLFLPYPNPYRPFINETAAEAVLALLDFHLATDCPPSQVAALFFEPVMSDGGLIVPPAGFFRAVEARLKPHGVLMVCDEVKVGLGRSGMMHCFQHDGVTPDVVTFAKGLGGGLPVSAVVGPADILNAAQGFAMETTSGNPISAAAAGAVLDTIEKENLVKKAQMQGAFLRDGLKHLAASHPLIGDVRGRGMAIGVELVRNRDTKQPAPLEAAKTVFRAHELGAVLYYVGLHSNVLELTPPLTLTADEAERGLTIIDQALDDVEKGRVPDEAVAGFQGW